MANTKRLLIVDDSEIDRTILSNILSKCFEVLEAENGYAALELITKNKLKTATPCFFSIYYEGTLCSNNLYSEEVFECPCTRGKKQPKSLACVSTLWTGCVKNEKSVTTKQDLDAP